jgi:hypothetical protein
MRTSATASASASGWRRTATRRVAEDHAQELSRLPQTCLRADRRSIQL